MSLDALTAVFAADVGDADPVTIAGLGTRGGAVEGVRTVTAPIGIDWIEPAEMTIRCGAATPVREVDAALAEHGQCVAIPPGGTVGGALAVGRSGIRRLGWGPVRDTVLQVRYVSAAGEVVTAGGPTVKNVSGFDLCRLLVGSHGTLGFLADVILRTRPLPPSQRWFRAAIGTDPHELLGALYRPISVLWDGLTTWVLLGGHPDDVARLAHTAGLSETDGPPSLPPHRWSVPPHALRSLDPNDTFVAEIGVGVVHAAQPPPPRPVDDAIRRLHERITTEFDPTGRLNPGVDVLSLAG